MPAYGWRGVFAAAKAASTPSKPPLDHNCQTNRTIRRLDKPRAERISCRSPRRPGSTGHRSRQAVAVPPTRNRLHERARPGQPESARRPQALARWRRRRNNIAAIPPARPDAPPGTALAATALPSANAPLDPVETPDDPGRLVHDEPLQSSHFTDWLATVPEIEIVDGSVTLA